jgi:hypothetical protein
MKCLLVFIYFVFQNIVSNNALQAVLTTADDPVPETW